MAPYRRFLNLSIGLQALRDDFGIGTNVRLGDVIRRLGEIVEEARIDGASRN